MLVSHIMTSDVKTCRRDDTLDDVRARCRKERISALPVLDADDTLAGIVTLTDLLPEWEPGTPVRRVMSPYVYTLPPSADAHLAARVMRSKRIHHVVVTEPDDAVVGIVSSYDLLQLVASPEGAADVVERGKASPRQILHAMLDKVTQRQAKVDDDLLRVKAPVEQDFAEAAVQLENDEVLQALNREGYHQLDAISAALEKLDAGTWGLCEDCNALIAIERLEALPYATTCVECAQAREAADA